MVSIEACVASVESGVAAHEGGADRLELNRALERDGLTPDLETFLALRGAVDLPIVVMVRPHDRGFVYSEDEHAGMLDDARRFLEAGAAGVVAGPLTPEGRIDERQLSVLLDVAAGHDFVFHRAFDTLWDMPGGLDVLVDHGVTRVLTSGGPATAESGVESLRRLVDHAAGRIEILPGGGVGPANASRILSRTGSKALHGTFRDPASPADGTDAGIVARVRAVADELSSGAA